MAFPVLECSYCHCLMQMVSYLVSLSSCAHQDVVVGLTIDIAVVMWGIVLHKKLYTIAGCHLIVYLTEMISRIKK